MVKKILFVMLVAIDTFATSSCSKDDPDAVETYTLSVDVKADNFSPADLEELKKYVDLGQTTLTRQVTLNAAKELVNQTIEKHMPNFKKIATELSGDQKVTMIISIYKGSSATGTPTFTKSVVTTKDGVVVK